MNTYLTTLESHMAHSETAMEVAAIDLGSNSFHMLVAHVSGGELRVIDRLRESVRLAAGLNESRRLTPEAQARALDCLRRFAERVKGIPAARVRAVGTNTMRKMRKGEDFIAAAEAALGHSIEVISGVEEARLVYGGVSHGLEDAPPRRLVVDIGGGSTEVIIGQLREPRLMESVALGCVVHHQRFFEDGRITASRFRKARLAARMELEFLERRYRDEGWDIAVGSSGTVRGIWHVLREQGWCDSAIDRNGLEKLIKLVIARGHVSQINFPALRDDRRPVFAGGLAVLAGVFDALQLEAMTTSDRALREGLIYDLMGRLSDNDIRNDSVTAMAQRFGVELRHAQRVAETADRLWVMAAESWQLDPASRSALGWAAQLHELGLSIAHSSYHKHGEYILRNADLHGFSQTDQKVLAALVRLHRGKLASSALDALPSAWAEPVRRLAVLLRLAVLMHRNREPGAAPEVQLDARGRQLDLSFAPGWLDVRPLTIADLEVESETLIEAGIRLRIHVPRP